MHRGREMLPLNNFSALHERKGLHPLHITYLNWQQAARNLFMTVILMYFRTQMPRLISNITLFSLQMAKIHLEFKKGTLKQHPVSNEFGRPYTAKQFPHITFARKQRLQYNIRC